MNKEFKRYGLSQFKALTGGLQILGATGLLVGLKLHPVLLISAGGLSLLMLLGVGVRIYIKDSLFQAFPAAVFFLLNLFIFLNSLN